MVTTYGHPPAERTEGAYEGTKSELILCHSVPKRPAFQAELTSRCLLVVMSSWNQSQLGNKANQRPKGAHQIHYSRPLLTKQSLGL